TKQATATSNRIRGHLTQIHPRLQTVIGPHLDQSAKLALLAHYSTPQALKHARKDRVETLRRKQAPRAWQRWSAAIATALDGQTVEVSGTVAAGLVLPRWATSLAQPRTSRDDVLARIEKVVEPHPLFGLLPSM